jgi:hypothetical protein
MKSINRRSLAVAAVAMGCALFTSTREAEAQGVPKADVLVIHATQCDKPSVDPAIGEAPPLKYNCYKLLDRKQLPLTKGNSGKMGLVNGRTFQVTLNDTTPDKRYKITASISQPDNSGFNKLADITADPNKRFYLGGFAYQGGAIVLAISIVP